MKHLLTVLTITLALSNMDVSAHDSTVVNYWPCEDKPACLVIHGADTVEVRHGHEIIKHCPKCDGNCIPDEGFYGGGISITAMYCLLGCCNTVTASAKCQVTDSSFIYRYGECDRVVWKIKHDTTSISEAVKDSVPVQHPAHCDTSSGKVDTTQWPYGIDIRSLFQGRNGSSSEGSLHGEIKIRNKGFLRLDTEYAIEYVDSVVTVCDTSWDKGWSVDHFGWFGYSRNYAEANCDTLAIPYSRLVRDSVLTLSNCNDKIIHKRIIFREVGK